MPTWASHLRRTLVCECASVLKEAVRAPLEKAKQPKDWALDHAVSGVSYVRQDCKYPLAGAVPFVAECLKRARDLPAPDFGTQGEAAGKTRGRKPGAVAKASAKAQASSGMSKKPTLRRGRSVLKASARSRAPRKASKVAKSDVAGVSEATHKRGKPTSKVSRKDRRSAKARAVARAKAEGVVDTAPSSSGRKRKAVEAPAAPDAPATSSSSRKRKPQTEEGRAVPTPARAKAKVRTAKPQPDNVAERVPPPHVTGNHIYSSAYRKAFAVSKDKDDARAKGREAVQHWKQHGTVNALCGEFRAQMRQGA